MLMVPGKEVHGMVQKFSGRPKADAIKVNMNLILDVPAEFAEQIELLGIYQFDKCIYDQERKQISLSACTTFYRKGA